MKDREITTLAEKLAELNPPLVFGLAFDTVWDDEAFIAASPGGKLDANRVKLPPGWHLEKTKLGETELVSDYSRDRCLLSV